MKWKSKCSNQTPINNQQQSSVIGGGAGRRKEKVDDNLIAFQHALRDNYNFNYTKASSMLSSLNEISLLHGHIQGRPLIHHLLNLYAHALKDQRMFLDNLLLQIITKGR